MALVNTLKLLSPQRLNVRSWAVTVRLYAVNTRTDFYRGVISIADAINTRYNYSESELSPKAYQPRCGLSSVFACVCCSNISIFVDRIYLFFCATSDHRKAVARRVSTIAYRPSSRRGVTCFFSFAFLSQRTRIHTQTVPVWSRRVVSDTRDGHTCWLGWSTRDHPKIKITLVFFPFSLFLYLFFSLTFFICFLFFRSPILLPCTFRHYRSGHDPMHVCTNLHYVHYTLIRVETRAVKNANSRASARSYYNRSAMAFRSRENRVQRDLNACKTHFYRHVVVIVSAESAHAR